MSINRYVVGEGKLKAPSRRENMGQGLVSLSFFMLTYYKVLLYTQAWTFERFSRQQLFSASPG